MADFAKYHEGQLLQELANGSVKAFDQLYYRYYDTVRANIFKIMREDAVTDDLLQEVFISLWEKRARFAGYEKISRWIFVASYNRSMNFLKRQTTERIYKKTLPEEKYLIESSEQESLQEEQFRLLEDAIGQLPPQRKRVFELCRLQGKTYEQTAAELSISRNTVKEHLSKATESIKNYIEKHPGGSVVLASMLGLFLNG